MPMKFFVDCLTKRMRHMMRFAASLAKYVWYDTYKFLFSLEFSRDTSRI